MRASSAAAAVILALCFSLTFCVPEAQADSMDFDTTSFDVKVNVQQDNSAYITENIGVDITEPMHGIYRYIPLTNDVTYKDDDGNVLKSGTVSMKVEDISVTKDKYDVSTELGNKVIRIGDEDVTIDGLKDYELSYRVRFYDDGIDAYDSFYYNVLPFDWETPIDESTITVVMPKKVKKDDIKIAVGSGGGKSELVDWDLEGGKTITIRANEQLPAGTGITIGIKLPEGYFTGEMTHRFSDLLMTAAAIVAALGMLLLWFRFGRDPKSIQTVEFYPPEGITSADAGYIIDGTVDKEDVVSLMFYLAQQGCISIEEQGKKDFVIHKTGELPPTAKNYEQVFFEGLFAGGSESVRLSSLKEDFYDTFQATKEMIEQGFKKRKNRIFPSSASWTRLAVAGVTILAFAVIGFMAFRSYSSTMMVVGTGAALLLTLIAGFKGVRVQDRKYTKGKFSRVIHSLISLALVAGAGAIMWFVSDGSFSGLVMKAGFIALVVCSYFAMRYMQSRTKYGAEMLGKLLGFREFIRVAEKDRLEMLVEQNPQYYYDILPYAYVLGLSKKWAQKFEDIAIEQPDWYVSRSGPDMFNTFVFYNMCNSFSSRAGATISVPPASESGGGSFGGGGFSGGGGFGGGGGGGW